MYSRWQRIGILIPIFWAASKIVVPAGTSTSWPSIETLTIGTGWLISILPFDAGLRTQD